MSPTEPTHACPLPVAPATIDTPDVMAMLLPKFWHMRSLLKALRMCAIVVLLACCCVVPGHALNIRLVDWMPDGRAMVRVRRNGRLDEVPITPVVVSVVGRYLAERRLVAKKKGWTSEYLFVSSTGRPIPSTEVQRYFDRLRKRIRSPGTIAGMLKNFCLRQLRKGKDETASRRLRGLTKELARPRAALPDVSAETIERLLARTDPFKNLARQVGDDAAAERWLADRTTLVPMVLTPHPPAPDHPVVRALREVRWPRGKHACRVIRSQLWNLYGAQIDALMRERVIDGNLVARLMHTTLGNVHATIRYHFRRGRSRPFKNFKSSALPQRARDDDTTILAEIVATVLPDDPDERADALLARACKYGVALDGLINEGALRTQEAADIVGVSYECLNMIRVCLQQGVAPEAVMQRQRGRRVPNEWWKKVSAAAAERPDGDTTVALFCRLAAVGFPGGLDRLERWSRQNLTTRPAPITMTEQRLLDDLASIRWSTDPEAFEWQRSQATIASLTFLDGLVDERKVGLYRAAALLKLHNKRFASLRQALKAGVTPERALMPPSPVSNDVWQGIAAEHAKSPDEAPVPFFWRMVADHRYTGGEKRLKTFRKNLAIRATLLLDVTNTGLSAASP